MNSSPRYWPMLRLGFRHSRLLGLVLLLLGASLHAARKPNIIVILADDLGYGDVHCINPAGKIATPAIDRLAHEGMIFTDAHSSSAVCTPTRYGLLTGRYNWRSRLKSGVQGGMSPRLIEPGRLTLPGFLQQQGYHTAAIGKWHLGMDWPLKPNTPAFDDRIEKGEDGWRVDFSKPIVNGPNSVGFDYYFGIAASLDMVPYTFIENDHVTAMPTVDKDFAMMHGRPNHHTRRGPAAESFEASNVLPTLVAKALDYLSERAEDARNDKPFFLYLPFTAPHTPIAPTKEWQGKSGLNPYGDFVAQVDDAVAQMLHRLDALHLAENTLVIFTSDNGCSPEAKFDELRARGHDPSANFRGSKADIFEGGHRVPFMARWPGHVAKGSASRQLICLNDIFATCAEILGQKLPPNAAEDSVSLLPVLEGKDSAPLREALVHHSINGSFAIRQGDWKLILCPDSGGWSAPRPGSPAARGLPAIQLYNLASDPAETENVEAGHPDVVSRLSALLAQYVARGRSTPGPEQANTTPVRVTGLLPSRPNILFILVDDLGQRDLGCYGSTFYETPHVDRLAREGVRFTQAYAACPVCSPSRASILTGKWPQRTGVTDYIGAAQPEKWNRNTRLLPAPYQTELALSEVTLAEALRPAGYATFFAGKWHLGPQGRWPEDQGFDINKGGIDRGGPYGGNKYFSPYGNPRLDDGPPGEHLPDRLATETVNFIHAHKDQPFLAYLSFYSVHTPLMAREDLRKKYQEKRRRLGGEDHWGREGERDVRLVQDHAVYAGMVEAMDLAVGRVLQALDDSGLRDRTLVVFTSDNGGLSTSEGWPTSNAPLRAGKGWLYEGGIREPLIIRWPGVTPENTVNDTPVSSPDFKPTLLAAAQIANSEQLDGINLLPLLSGQGTVPDRGLFWHYPHYGNQGGAPGAAVRRGDWKLIEWFEDGSLELFNLKNDSSETTNLADRHPAITKKLRDELHAWQKDVHAVFPAVNPKYDPAKPNGRAARRPVDPKD